MDVGVNAPLNAVVQPLSPLDDSLRPEMKKVYLPREGVSQASHAEDLPSNPSAGVSVSNFPEQSPDPECAIASGFETTIQRSILLNGQPIAWTERVLCVKSFVYEQVQRKGLNNRLERAEAALRALTPPPGRGRKQYTDEAPLQAAIDQILKRHNVKGLLDVTFQRLETHRQIRAYGGRPARTETKVRFEVNVTKNADAIAKAERRLGFRLYATNALPEALSLSMAVLTYRGQYVAERDFARLNGRHLGITPLYVQRDDHACGLIRLLTLALRAMVMIEFLARRALAEQKATLGNIYAGNPTRTTIHPTCERMLAAFSEITLTRVQELILSLLGMSAAIYTDLVTGPVMVCEGKARQRYGKMRLNPSPIEHRASSCAVRVY